MPVIMLILSALLVAVDFATKHLAELYLKNNPVVLWEGVFELRYRENSGIAFSLLENQRWLFIPMTVIVVAVVAVMLFRSEWRKSAVFSLSCSLIIAGGIGNLIDRLSLGYVVDFLYFRIIDFPIFNFADCCVTVGAILLFVFILFLDKDSHEKPLKTVLFGIKATAGENDDGNKTVDDRSTK